MLVLSFDMTDPDGDGFTVTIPGGETLHVTIQPGRQRLQLRLGFEGSRNSFSITRDKAKVKEPHDGRP